jgi:N5-(carboxyethyl)ornithine synthase
VELLVKKEMTGISLEKLRSNNRLVLWKNMELTGKMGVICSIPYTRKVPEECNVAVLGKGEVGKAAIKILEQLGASIKTYNSKNIDSLIEELPKYDLIVNCVSLKN